jgi:error-prone DNA polymerase
VSLRIEPDPFVHLHVASGWSLRHGASHPQALVARAAELGMDTLALTDRDGVHGAVKFAKAGLTHGIRPILGVDLAIPEPVPPGQRQRGPARGGAVVDPRHPRVVVLAKAGRRTSSQVGAGWAAVNRLVSAAHQPERGVPVASLDLIGAYAAGGDLLVLLGPASALGRALAARRPDLARAVLAAWRDRLGSEAVLIEVVSHHGPPDGSPLEQATAPSDVLGARLLGFARDHGARAVLTNAVRYATSAGAATADVLDATRRLVALEARHVDRRTAEASLKSGPAMRAVAKRIVQRAGGSAATDREALHTLLATTRSVAEACILDPAEDLGLGRVHLPELKIVDQSGAPAGSVLRARCEAGLEPRYGRATSTRRHQVRDRLEEELAVIDYLGYWTYFLTVAEVCDLTRTMGIRVAARGSGAGSLVLHLLDVSGVDPLRHGLLMERFLTRTRQALPDVDVDVESARRTELYERILGRFGSDRCACVSMTDTYRVRHAIRDVGAALGLPPGEVDTIAKAFPHIRARDARAALRDLPELRASRLGGSGEGSLDTFFTLVESLDGLPRHLALHPCGVLLSDGGLLDRTAVESSYLGFPMSQFDKDDVEDLGLLKLDVLGIRMQSAMAHAVLEIARVDGVDVRLDDEESVALDDPATFALIQSAHTLGCFQIESPGQRELIGKFGPETFDDLITDISLFRPGPVKSDMVTPFLRARQGWSPPEYLHDRLRPALEETYGVVVFHEQVIRIIAELAGCALDEADERRRDLGSPDGQAEVREWIYPLALSRGFTLPEVERIWAVLQAFASFGFCKAHAAAFALPTYQSAWLKAHHPAAFLSGVLTHDPGMYPKRLILDDARQLGIAILGLDVNTSEAVYRVERIAPWDAPPPGILGAPPRAAPDIPGLPDGRAYGIRLSLAEVKGINDAEVERIVAGRPYASLADFWHRAGVSRPVVERLVVAGAFDNLYGLGSIVPVRRRGQVTRRDLLLQVGDLDRWTRSVGKSAPRAVRTSTTKAAQPDVQLALDLGDSPETAIPTGLPEMTGAERVRAELDVLGLDVSRHVVDFYVPVLRALGVTRARDLLRQRSEAEVLVAGVKVATQTPPIRSGRRVVFLTLDDATGPVDATFFEDAQGPYAATVFHSWLLVVRGHVRRTGPRGISLRATGAWELSGLYSAWEADGLEGAYAFMAETAPLGEVAVEGWADSRSSRPVVAKTPAEEPHTRAGGMGQRRVLVHASGFRQSPYSDVKPPGEDAKKPPRKLWHSSPGSSGA